MKTKFNLQINCWEMQRTAGLFMLLVASDLDPATGVASSKTLAKYVFGICLLCLVLMLCSVLFCFVLSFFVWLFTAPLFQTNEGACSSFAASLWGPIQPTMCHKLHQGCWGCQFPKHPAQHSRSRTSAQRCAKQSHWQVVVLCSS